MIPSRRKSPRRALVTEADRRRHRADWALLAEAAETLVLDGEAMSGADRQALGDRAVTARNAWPWPVDWPQGLVFEALAILVAAWCRAGPADRARIVRVTAACAASAREVLDVAEARAALGTDPAATDEAADD